jgi:Na+/H+ antiporter NhaC
VLVWFGSLEEQSPLEIPRKLLLRILFFSVLFAVICVLAAWSQKASGMPATAPWYSIVPPLLAIMLAFLTRRVIPSLGIAVIVGGLLTSVPAAPLTVTAWWGGIKSLGGYIGQAVGNATNLQILGFFPPIFIMVAVIGVTGGFQGIIGRVLRWVRGGKSAQAATALMGLVYFIDDYSNSMIVGSAMRPVTDRHGISREKLAFLVDATSAPIAGLAVISTWIAYEVSLFAETGAQLGIAKDGYAMFFDALGYRFYCLLMIAFVFLHIFSGRDFGPMRTAQQKAKERHVPSSDKQAVESIVGGKARNAVIPLAGLVLSHLTGLWLDGGGWAKLAEGGSLWQWQYWREVIGNAEHSTLVLDYAALIGMTLALLCGFFTKTLTRRDTATCLWEGTKRSLLPIVILTLAWSLKNSCISLQTDTFLATLLAGRIPPPGGLGHVLCHRHELGYDGDPDPHRNPAGPCPGRRLLRLGHHDQPGRRARRGDLRRSLLPHLRHHHHQLNGKFLRPHAARPHTIAIQPVRGRHGPAVRLPAERVRSQPARLYRRRRPGHDPLPDAVPPENHNRQHGRDSETLIKRR